jgi:hypothetical protein
LRAPLRLVAVLRGAHHLKAHPGRDDDALKRPAVAARKGAIGPLRARDERREVLTVSAHQRVGAVQQRAGRELHGGEQLG